jgi:hypothetical protein
LTIPTINFLNKLVKRDLSNVRIASISSSFRFLTYDSRDPFGPAPSELTKDVASPSPNPPVGCEDGRVKSSTSELDDWRGGREGDLRVRGAKLSVPPEEAHKGANIPPSANPAVRTNSGPTQKDDHPWLKLRNVPSQKRLQQFLDHQGV